MAPVNVFLGKTVGGNCVVIVFIIIPCFTLLLLLFFFDDEVKHSKQTHTEQ
jgi:hypothetical protein